jgi:hypothetical protein
MVSWWLPLNLPMTVRIGSRQYVDANKEITNILNNFLWLLSNPPVTVGIRLDANADGCLIEYPCAQCILVPTSPDAAFTRLEAESGVPRFPPEHRDKDTHIYCLYHVTPIMILC